MAWVLWLALTLMLGGYLAYSLWGEDKAVYLIGATTHGHHQIELACNSCHSEAFSDREVLQDACMDCHGAELKAAEDSHPRRKFTDPRHADRVALLDARYCITCHVEHQPDLMRPAGVTQPEDVCFLCHCDIGDERPSHAGLAFDTCVSAGCHNYHDNRALYEDFLVKHLHEPRVGEDPRTARRNLAEIERRLTQKPLRPLTLSELDAPFPVMPESKAVREWAATAHAAAGVNCMHCHGVGQGASGKRLWRDRVEREACKACHAEQVEGFLAGKHGMRPAQHLAPMRPALARLPMKSEAHERELSCTACHTAHRFDTRKAAVDVCLGCHDDAHSRAYRDSPHFRLWRAELGGEAPSGTGVSCATCHLPREVQRREGLDAVRVQHNQNDNLRPNEKMIRSVCLGCHGLAFSIDSLADPGLVENNFGGNRVRHVESLDWAERRFKQGLTREKDKERKFKSIDCGRKLPRLFDFR